MSQVLYVKCPHCHTGWYGEYISHSTTEYEGYDSIPVFESLIIQGLNPTDLCRPIKCLACGREYLPIEDGLHWMEDWVARAVINTKGN